MLRNCRLIAIAYFLLWTTLAQPSTQAASRYDVTHWEQELPQSSVIAITQTRDGFLWLGTLGGLARFDGVLFKVFNDGNTPGLNNKNIVRLFEDSHENLWIGTDKGGVILVSKEGKVTGVDLGTAGSEAGLVSICEDAAGAVWLHLGDYRLYVYRQGRAGEVLRGCSKLMADESGLVWVATTNGKLFALRPAAGATAMVVEYELPVRNVDFLLPSKQGGYWRLADGRIQKWNRDQLVNDLGPYPWPAGIAVTTACEDQQGNLIVGTSGDYAFWFDGKGKNQHLSEESTGIKHATILSLCMDREGSLWVGTDGRGLYRLRRHLFEVIDEEHIVRSVCEDAQGALWLASGGKLVQMKDGKLTTHPLTGEKSPDVQVVLPTPDNTILAGTAIAGVFELKDNQARQLPGSQTPGQVATLYIDQKRTLWAGGRNGLVYWDEQGRLINTAANGRPIRGVQAITGDREGTLWVGTDGAGLMRLSGEKIESFTKTNGLPSNNLSYLYIDDEGVIWVGTSGGLGRFHTGKWTRYGKDQGLVNESIGYIVEDKQGFLWLGSYTGLTRTEKKALNSFATGATNPLFFRVYGEADGFSEAGFGFQPAACCTRDGKLWFPTKSGVATVDPARLNPNTNPPPVAIESVRIDGKSQHATALRSLPPSQIDVPAGSESLEIDYASLNLGAPEKGRFKFRLEGYESIWSERSGDQRSTRYPRLPPGHYRFQLTACNEDAIWNERGTSLAITVLPPFWRTWWFLTIAGLCLLGMIVGSVHYVSTQQLHRQLESLRQQEALERERARIARDLHDQLGANLTQVTLLGEMAEADKNVPAEVEEHAQQICQTARETTRALDEIVWTVNPSNDTLEGLVNYVCKYAQDYLGVAGLKYRLDVPPNLPATPISPELRHNVFLAAKESITNIVKHAKATAAVVRLRLEPDGFALEIEDDGQGLANMDEKRAATRNGLRNMRKRMEDVGGTFSMTPGPGRGTVVRLKAPLENY